MLGAHLAAASLAISPVQTSSAHDAPISFLDTDVALAIDAEQQAEPLSSAPSATPESAAELPPSGASSDLSQSQSGPLSLDTITAPINLKKFPDPLEPLNRISYAITQPIDRFILRPAALLYQAVTPKPMRDMARNAINNLGDSEVFINDVLQLRPKRAVKTLFRIIINTTIGVGGIFDLAKRKPFNLPQRGNNFENTLGYYGIGPIAYLYIPVLGPSNLRDVTGQFTNGYFRNRILYNVIRPSDKGPFFPTDPQLGTTGTVIGIVGGLGIRAELDPILKRVTENSVDPYATFRASYLQDRAAEIAELKAKDGEQPINDNMDDPLLDPESQPASSPGTSSPDPAKLKPGPSQ